MNLDKTWSTQITIWQHSKLCLSTDFAAKIGGMGDDRYIQKALQYKHHNWKKLVLCMIFKNTTIICSTKHTINQGQFQNGSALSAWKRVVDEVA